MRALILFICIISFSCNSDFLEQRPLSNISDSDFWNTANDLELYCNNFYNNMLSQYGNTNIGIYGLDAHQGSDNMIALSYNSILNGERTVPESGGGWNWNQLRNINYFLDHYNNVDEPWDIIKQYVGEALFFRSWYYFDMLKKFGNLPWINKSLDIDSDDLYSGRLDRNIIVDSMLNDLDRAIDYLPSRNNTQSSRISREIAMLFQARIALYEGTWEKYHSGTSFGVNNSDGSNFLQKASEVAFELIESGVHSLDNVDDPNGYWSLFNQEDYSISEEVMFWREFNADYGITHESARFTNRSAGIGITKDLVDSYLCSDGLPIAKSELYKGDANLLNVVENRDPRLRQTIYNPGDVVTTNQPNGDDIIFTVPAFDAEAAAKAATGYQLYKGHNTDYWQQYSRFIGTTPWIIFRYSEALLIYAESKAELGNIVQNDLDISINQLRDRVGMPPLLIDDIEVDPNWQFPELSPIINEIRRERRVELACEGFRHDDIFRWAAADNLISGWKPKGAILEQWSEDVSSGLLDFYPIDENGYIELYQTVLPDGYAFNTGRDYLSPIPTTELVLNPSINQNPGW